jgi:hypothetical protein
VRPKAEIRFYYIEITIPEGRKLREEGQRKFQKNEERRVLAKRQS